MIRKKGKKNNQAYMYDFTSNFKYFFINFLK